MCPMRNSAQTLPGSSCTTIFLPISQMPTQACTVSMALLLLVLAMLGVVPVCPDRQRWVGATSVALVVATGAKLKVLVWAVSSLQNGQRWHNGRVVVVKTMLALLLLLLILLLILVAGPDGEAASRWLVLVSMSC